MPPFFYPRRFEWCRCIALGGLLWMSRPGTARAEDALTVKRQWWQEESGRIEVDSVYVLVEKDLTPDTKLKAMGLIDTIAGATPLGTPAPAGSDQVPLSPMEDRRKAWEVGLAQQLQRFNLAATYAQSREDDYVSKGWSLNTLTDFNDKNTAVRLGYARADDRINATSEATKDTNDFIVGVTQLLDPSTALTLNFSYGTAHGYLADPYKVVSKSIEIFGLILPLTWAENRPDERDKKSVFLQLNRAFERVGGALDASYRLYRDDFGIESHTIALEWYQRIGSDWIVRPAARFYRQTAADFYFYNYDLAGLPIAVVPGEAPYYSSDYRLTEFDTMTLGIKVIWQATPWLSFDAAVERYLMRSRDGVTPASAFSDADIITIGFKLSR